eukprot:1393234-Amorphochlora_amoeboformis.AAC.2
MEGKLATSNGQAREVRQQARSEAFKQWKGSLVWQTSNGREVRQQAIDKQGKLGKEMDKQAQKLGKAMDKQGKLGQQASEVKGSRAFSTLRSSCDKELGT